MELRAEGMSYAAIAKKLKVSKTTLVAWSREHQTDLDNLRTIANEALQARFKVGLEEVGVDNCGVVMAS